MSGSLFWLQSAADLYFVVLCVETYTSRCAIYCQTRVVVLLQARDEQDNPRLNGGDTFQVLLLPGRPATAAAVPLARQLAAAAAAAAAAADGACSSQTLQHQLDSAGAGNQTSKQSVVSAAAAAAAAVAEADGCLDITVDLDINTAAEDYQELLQPEDSDMRPDMSPEVVTAVAVGEVQDNGDGTYSCSYSHTVAGAYEMHVLNGESKGHGSVVYCFAASTVISLLGHCIGSYSCSYSHTVAGSYELHVLNGELQECGQRLKT
jgi:hypothetical protein